MASRICSNSLYEGSVVYLPPHMDGQLKAETIGIGMTKCSRIFSGLGADGHQCAQQACLLRHIVRVAFSSYRRGL